MPHLGSRNVHDGSGKRTSMRLEPQLWEVLGKITRRRNMTTSEFIGEAEKQYPNGTRTSAVRVHIVVQLSALAQKQLG